MCLGERIGDERIRLVRGRALGDGVDNREGVEYINNIMESMGCTIDQAMKALKINPNEYAMYKDLMGM